MVEMRTVETPMADYHLILSNTLTNARRSSGSLLHTDRRVYQMIMWNRMSSNCLQTIFRTRRIVNLLAYCLRFKICIPLWNSKWECNDAAIWPAFGRWLVGALADVLKFKTWKTPQIASLGDALWRCCRTSTAEVKRGDLDWFKLAKNFLVRRVLS